VDRLREGEKRRLGGEKGSLRQDRKKRGEDHSCGESAPEKKEDLPECEKKEASSRRCLIPKKKGLEGKDVASSITKNRLNLLP